MPFELKSRGQVQSSYHRNVDVNHLYNKIKGFELYAYKRSCIETITSGTHSYQKEHVDSGITDEKTLISIINGNNNVEDGIIFSKRSLNEKGEYIYLTAMASEPLLNILKNNGEYEFSKKFYENYSSMNTIYDLSLRPDFDPSLIIDFNPSSNVFFDLHGDLLPQAFFFGSEKGHTIADDNFDLDSLEKYLSTRDDILFMPDNEKDFYTKRLSPDSNIRHYPSYQDDSDKNYQLCFSWIPKREQLIEIGNILRSKRVSKEHWSIMQITEVICNNDIIGIESFRKNSNEEKYSI